MFVRLTVLLFFFGNCSFAQLEGLRSPTKFDKFISSPKVTWAAYSNDTLRFDTLSFTDELLKRFQKNEIKISFPISRDSLMTNDKITYLDKKQLDQMSYPPGEFQTPTNRIDNRSNFVNVEQILYVADGKLYSYIPWVTPEISIYTSSGRFIASSEYFSSCINDKYNFSSSKRDKLVSIKSTKKKISLNSIPGKDMLKQLYGLNILEAIWNDLLDEKNEVIEISSGKNILLKNIREFNSVNSVIIPLYDSSGNIVGTKKVSEPLIPLLFQQIEITQNWFYNRSKNVVINNIPEIILYRRMDPYNETEELKPVLKITFK